MAVLGGVLLGLGALGLPWWISLEQGLEYRVSPTGLSLCRADDCRRGALALLGSGSSTWGKLGAAVAAAGILAAALAFVVGGLALSRRTGGRAYQPRAAGWSGLLGFSLAAVFAISLPSGQGMEVGSGLVAYFIGGAVLVGSSLALLPPRG